MFGQQRSQSGPGGLSINTGSANTLFGSSSNVSQAPQSGSIFGSSKPSGIFGSTATVSAGPQTAGLFGSSGTTGGFFGSQNNSNQQQQSSNSFGNQPKPNPSIFQPQQQQQPGEIFGSNPTQQPQPTGGLFGSTIGQNQSQAQQSGGIFGSAIGQNQNQNPQSLFGSNTVSQAQQAGGLFGSATNTQNQNQPQNQTGGLFGASLAQPSQQGGSVFGLGAAQQQQQGGGLFQSINATQNQPQLQQQQAGSIFGQNNAPKPSLFSQSLNQNPLSQTQQAPNSMFSSSIGQYSQQQQIVPGVRIDLSNLRPSTRFNDLHEVVQKRIEHVDKFILDQIHLHDECEQVMPRVESALSYIPNDVDFCARKLDAMQHALENDAAVIDSNKTIVKRDAENAKLSFKAIQNQRMPPQFHHASLWSVPSASQASAGPGLHYGGEEGGGDGSSADLMSYFSHQIDKMSRTLDNFQRNVAEVETYLKGVEANTTQQVQRLQFSRGRDGGARSADDQVRELTAVFREFEKGILGVAGKVGGVRELVLEATLGGGGVGGGGGGGVGRSQRETLF